MSYLSSDTERFALSITPFSSGFHLLDDVFGLMAFTGFSVIQAQYIGRLALHLKKGDFKPNSRTGKWFGVAHIALGSAYLICATLVVANFLMKLGLVAQHTLPLRMFRSPSGYFECPDGYSIMTTWSWICMEDKWEGLRFASRILDFIINVLFHVTLLLSDSILIYRCFIMLEHPWVYGAMAAAALRTGWFIFEAIDNFRGLVTLVTHYVSLLTLVVTLMTLLTVLWQAKRDARSSMGDTQTPFNSFMWIIVAALLPPIAIGFVHIGLLAGIQIVPVGLNALWLSLTVLASQSITLRVFKLGDHGVMNGKASQAISLPSSVTRSRASEEA